MLATPHTAHFEQIVRAAHAGKHVYCEKPFCLTGADAAGALEALAGNGLKVAVGHNRRFFANSMALKQTIDAGALGEMIQIEGNFSGDFATARGYLASQPRGEPGGRHDIARDSCR